MPSCWSCLDEVGEGESCDNCGMCNCGSCRANHEDGRDSGINNPYVKMGKGPLFIGVELEVEGGYDGRLAFMGPEWVHSVCGDGSLDDGFELRSQPMDYGEWVKRWKEVTKHLAKMAKAGYTTDEGCGLHVHMTKRPWSSLRLLKLLTLCYDNPCWLSQLGGRDFNSYCSISSDTPIVEKAARRTQPARYEAVNLTGGRTIEFRFFQGTIDPLAVRMAIEFADATYRWCGAVSLRHVNPASFQEWVAFRKKTYPALGEYCRQGVLLCA